MDKDIEKQALKALEQKKAAQKRRNDWEKQNRDRIVALFPVGTRDRIKALGEKSVNDYLNRLVADDLNRREQGEQAPGGWETGAGAYDDIELPFA